MDLNLRSEIGLDPVRKLLKQSPDPSFKKIYPDPIKTSVSGSATLFQAIGNYVQTVLEKPSKYFPVYSGRY